LLFERLRRLEEEGRRRAARRDEPPYSDVGWLDEVRDASLDLAEELERLGDMDFAEVADWISLASEGALRDTARRCAARGIPRGECLVPPAAQSDLEAIDEAYERATGKRCTWLLGEIENYTLSAALNDLTSCFHRVMERYEDLAGGYERKGKCLFKDADPSLKEACEEWSKVVEKFKEQGLYTAGNYDALYFRAEDGKAEIRVGETAGHLAHLDLNTGTLEYYDVNPDVKRLAKELLEEECGLKCEVTPESTTCKGANRKNASCIAKIMAALSSARFRIYEPEKWWREIPRECRIGDKVEREKCLIRRKLKEINKK